MKSETNLDTIFRQAGRTLDQLSEELLSVSLLGRDAPPPRRPRLLILSATSLVVLTLGALVVSDRLQNGTPPSIRPAAAEPNATVPKPSGTSIPPSTIGSPLAEQPTGSLLNVGAPSTVAPLVVLDLPDWAMNYFQGDEDVPLGDIEPNHLVAMGPGLRYESPYFDVWATPTATAPVLANAVAIRIGGIEGQADVNAVTLDNGSTSQSGMLTWPLPDGRTAVAVTSRMSVDEAVALASIVDFSGASPTATFPDGYTVVSAPPPSQWLQMDFQFANGGASVQVDGSNLGGAGLTTFIGTEVRASLSVDGVAVGYTVTPRGAFRATWLDGGWVYDVTAIGITSEAQFVEILHSLKAVDTVTFNTAAGALDPVLAGDQVDAITELEQGLLLPANTPTTWAPNAIATNHQHFAFQFLLGLGCGWRRTWLNAIDNSSASKRDAAVAGVESLAIKAETIDPTQSQYTQLAAAMRSGDQSFVEEFGGDSCPTWSVNVG